MDIRSARLSIGISMRELAAMAGVSPSTVSRIEAGTLDPTTEVAAALNLALGFKMVVAPDCQPSAIAACRGLIDPSTGLANGPAAQPWVDRWRRARFLDANDVPRDPRRVCMLAGRSNRLLVRTGAVVVSALPWFDLAARASATGLAYVFTGGAALNAIEMTVDEQWTIAYVDDPEAAAAALGMARVSWSGYGRSALLLPADAASRTGVWESDDGGVWVDPVQAAIDCYGGLERMSAAADLIWDRLEQTSAA